MMLFSMLLTEDHRALWSGGHFRRVMKQKENRRALWNGRLTGRGGSKREKSRLRRLFGGAKD